MATATASKPLKSFKLSCPCCGAEDAITLDLNDLSGVTCSSCDDTFTVATAIRKVSDQLRRWQGVARWIALAGDALAMAGEDLAEDSTEDPTEDPFA